MKRDAVVVQAPVTVRCVPDGHLMELSPGMPAVVTQALGGSFTLLVEGQLVRLEARDAHAIGREPPDQPAAGDTTEPLDERIRRLLKTCYDPEIPVDIVELGLVYGCHASELDDGRIRLAVELTLTAPGCGMGELLAEDVADKLLTLPEVGEVNVQMVFDPPWDRSRLSEAALLTLGL
jgi:probable FeS assembly SUF system protein SufT